MEFEVREDPNTHVLAQRTVFPADGDRAYRVYRPDRAPHYVAAADVELWTVLVPEVPTPEE